jgi:hypothetical protein
VSLLVYKSGAIIVTAQGPGPITRHADPPSTRMFTHKLRSPKPHMEVQEGSQAGQRVSQEYIYRDPSSRYSISSTCALRPCVHLPQSLVASPLITCTLSLSLVAEPLEKPLKLLWFAPRATITARFSDHVTGYRPSKSRETGWHVTLRTARGCCSVSTRPTPCSAVAQSARDPHRAPLSLSQHPDPRRIPSLE